MTTTTHPTTTGESRQAAAKGAQCCPPAEQSSCCAPAQKAACCEGAGPEGCGCR